MTDQVATQDTYDPGFVLPGYRWLATLVAVLVIVQAFLGTRGVFANEGDLIEIHEMIANTMFLLVVIQTVLAWMLFNRKLVGMAQIGLNILLVLLTIAQIGLGYSTRNGERFVDMVSLHIPTGVLLMGVSAAVATMAWRVGIGRTQTPAV